MNIFNDSNYNSQSSIPTNITVNSITANDIIIPNSNTGDILFTNANKQINGLVIGPQNYLLQSSGIEPQWSNLLNVNTVIAEDIKINNTVHGDIFTPNNIDGNFERVVLGPLGSILMSDGADFDWVSLNDGNAFVYGGELKTEKPFHISGNQYFNIPITNTLLFTFNTPVIQGRSYKFTICGRHNSTDAGNYLLNVGATTYCSWALEKNADICRSFIYSHITSSGFVSVNFFGSAVISLNNSIVQMNFISEPFNF